jgi:hypothetical protein
VTRQARIAYLEPYMLMALTNIAVSQSELARAVALAVDRAVKCALGEIDVGVGSWVLGDRCWGAKPVTPSPKTQDLAPITLVQKVMTERRVSPRSIASKELCTSSRAIRCVTSSSSLRRPFR